MNLIGPLICYRPLRDEVSYLSYFPSAQLTNSMFLPVDKNSDPFRWAAKCARKYREEIPRVLIPGKVFDLRGTRRGRGFGWYDRFLAAIPRAWPRIGVANISQLSFSRLEHQPWDEPVDWLLIRDVSSWCLYETKARFQ